MKYKKYLRNVRNERIFVILISSLSFIGGLVGIIIQIVRDDYDYFSLCCIIAFVVPVVLASMYFVWLATGDIKRYEGIQRELFESTLSSDEIMKIGETLNVDLFSVALDVRCLKELNMDRVPEWCFRDRILPDTEI